MVTLTMCKKICKECPFSIDSIQGYLDYHTTDEILSDMSKELPFTCHLQRKENQHLNLIEIIDLIIQEYESLARTLYKDLMAAYEDLTSDECVADTLIANEYEFLENGKRV